MRLVGKGPGSFFVIDRLAVTLLLVGEMAIRSEAEAVPVRPRGDQAFHRLGVARRGCVPVLQQETTGREGSPTAARRQFNRMSGAAGDVWAPCHPKRTVVPPARMLR
jgi:hypothetical protein